MKGILLGLFIVGISLAVFVGNSYAAGRRGGSACAGGACKAVEKSVRIEKGWWWDKEVKPAPAPAPSPLPPVIVPVPPPVTPTVVAPCAPVATCGPVDKANSGRRHIVLKAVKAAGMLAIKPLKLLTPRR